MPGTGHGPPDGGGRNLEDVEILESGHISLAVDACGTNEIVAYLEVLKPNDAATVRCAYLAVASTGFRNYVIPDGEVTINGLPISWDLVVPSGINSHNHWADVSLLIAGLIDPEPAGIIDLEVTEFVTSMVDGEILFVIFDDPEETTINTVLISFGAQSTDGDTFSIGFGEPLEIIPELVMDFGLGISYSYQDGSQQYCEVDVNGSRLTSSAGGCDDGLYENGALITVGGFDDDNANPPDPWQTADGSTDFTFYDDELYDLLPFVSAGDLGISVFTLNPSADDNIMTAHLVMSVPAVLGEGVVLTPGQAWLTVGETHELTATLQDDNGGPVADRQVDFEILTGPHSGQTGTDITNDNGQAFFS